MNNMILTQIPAQSTFKFYIIITSMQLNPLIVMSTIKFISEIIEIYFSARTFHLKVDQCHPIFRWSLSFLEMFSRI